MVLAIYSSCTICIYRFDLHHNHHHVLWQKKSKKEHFLLPLLLLSFLFHLMRKKALWSQTAFGRSVHGYESHIGLFLAKRRKGDFVGHSDLLLFLLLLWKKLAGKKSGSYLYFLFLLEVKVVLPVLTSALFWNLVKKIKKGSQSSTRQKCW